MSWQFLRYYVTVPHFYLNLTQYLNGEERLPFQYRILPVFFLKPLRSLTLVKKIALSRAGALHNPDVLCQFLLAAISLAFIYVFTILLYQAISTTRRLEFLVYPILMFILLWTYCIHVEHDFSYPYDLPSVGFFTAGVYFVYKRRFLPLLLIFLFGTFNRETTIFLIGIYLIDCASLQVPGSLSRAGLHGRVYSKLPIAWIRRNFNLSQIPWLRVIVLTAIWAAIKIMLTHRFSVNDRSELKSRFSENLRWISSPNEWPVALNVGGYVLPIVLFFTGKLADRRVANYFLVLIPWVIVMLGAGVIIETRIYGEFSALTAICATLLIERYAGSTADMGGTAASA